MNARVYINGILAAVCLAEVVWILVLHGQENQLREEQQHYLSRLAAPSAGSVAAPAAGPLAPDEPSHAETVVSPELLRLRSEATRLARQKRQLAGVAAEGERLRAELAAQATNATAGAGVGRAVPPGFIRKSEARNMGSGSPEDTIQTLLWAAQNHDITNVLALFAPEIAQKLQAESENKSNFFEGVDSLVGFGVVGRQQLAPDLIQLSVIANDDTSPQPVSFRLLNGQWKVEKPP
jgi:hypothetical protein